MSMYTEDQRYDSFHELFNNVYKPIIGMLHLLPLPGSPLYEGGGLGPIIERALLDAEALQAGGVDGLEVENFGDPTYVPDMARPELIASLAVVADHVKREVSIPLGICLLADPRSGLGVAHAVGARFIRATFFTEASVDVSGLVLPRPHDLLLYRKSLDRSIKIFADVHIKHSAPLAMRPIGDSALDAKYFLADAILISGTHTGKEVKLDDLQQAKDAVGRFPILLGSGLRADNATQLLKIADGAIAGTSLKKDGVSANPVDVKRVKKLMKSVEAVRQSLV